MSMRLRAALATMVGFGLVGLLEGIANAARF